MPLPRLVHQAGGASILIEKGEVHGFSKNRPRLETEGVLSVLNVLRKDFALVETPGIHWDKREYFR